MDETFMASPAHAAPTADVVVGLGTFGRAA
jgi:hypothetical protein